jgi:hypothetical protein
MEKVGLYEMAIPSAYPFLSTSEPADWFSQIWYECHATGGHSNIRLQSFLQSVIWSEVTLATLINFHWDDTCRECKNYWNLCDIWYADRAWTYTPWITGFFGLFHCPVFYRLENTTFRKLDLCPYSGERGGKTPTQLGPLERANLNHWTSLALSKWPNQVGVFSPVTWGQKQIQFLKRHVF